MRIAWLWSLLVAAVCVFGDPVTRTIVGALIPVMAWLVLPRLRAEFWAQVEQFVTRRRAGSSAAPSPAPSPDHPTEAS